jgi:hypothetical protein
LRIVSIIPGIETAAPEQRVGGVAEALPGALLERREVLPELGLEPVGKLAARGHVGTARVRRDRETRGDRDAELGHLGQTDPLPAEQRAAAVGGLVEVVDVARKAHEGRESSHMLALCPGLRSSDSAATRSAPTRIATSRTGSSG